MSSSNSTTGASASPVEEVRECRCMFCGEMLILRSEAEAIEHMSVCPALTEQLSNKAEQFTIPKCVEEQMGSEQVAQFKKNQNSSK